MTLEFGAFGKLTPKSPPSSAATRSRSTARQWSPATLLARLNRLGHDNGIGRLDLVENRFVGMKSRSVYEMPGGTILLAAHRGIELITLDGGARLRIAAKRERRAQ